MIDIIIYEKHFCEEGGQRYRRDELKETLEKCAVFLHDDIIGIHMVEIRVRKRDVVDRTRENPKPRGGAWVYRGIQDPVVREKVGNGLSIFKKGVPVPGRGIDAGRLRIGKCR